MAIVDLDDCPLCNGSGYIEAGFWPCPECRGTGMVEVTDDDLYDDDYDPGRDMAPTPPPES